MSRDTSIRSPTYYSSILLYNKGVNYNGGNISLGSIYEFIAYRHRDKRRSKLSKTIYTRKEHWCMVYADSVYEAYITLLDFGYTDIVIINP